MQSIRLPAASALLLSTAFASILAHAALPALTPKEQQAATVKAQTAAEQAAKAKAELSASMDQVVMRWRASAAQNGWKAYPATAVQAPAAPQAAASATPPPARSEKQGTAPASADVKDPAKKGL